MNTDPYERRLDRATESTQTAGEAAGVEPNALARLADPSLTPHGPAHSAEGSSVAWVRPSEMPIVIGSKFIRRGIDLQAELNRRAQRAPRAAGRVTRHAIARSTPSAPTVDRGVEL